jgi:hypothetical protein
MALLRAAMQTMKKHFTLLTSAACFFAFLTFAPDAPGQTTDPAAKLQALSQQLKLTPQQKIQMLPILKEEGPKIEAIKNNSFATANAENEATPGHPQRKRAADAENSEPCTV